MKNPFNTIYVLINGIIKPTIIQGFIAELIEALMTANINSDGSSGIENAIENIANSNQPNNTVPAYDFGNSYYYVKLENPNVNNINNHNPVRVIVPYIEIINNLAPVVGKIGFAMAFANLSIISEYPVIDSNTGKPIISTKTMPKFTINETVNINIEEQSSQQIISNLISIAEIPVKPNNNCEFILHQ